ncbi:MAG: hypothetical protein ACLFMT_01120 [Halobacteriales archaeon]
MSQPRVRAAGDRRYGGVVSTVVETAGLKAVVLLGFLFAVTVYSALNGVRAVEGVTAGAALVVLLAAALAYDRAKLSERVDLVGVVVLLLATGYVYLEYLGVRQYVWYPMAAATVLAAVVAYEAYRWLDDPDVVEFFTEVDVVGLYGVVLLLIYSLLLAGGHLDFIYSPYFPAMLFVFVATVFTTSISYLNDRHENPDRGELHGRLISVVRGLKDIDHEDRAKLVSHVRAVANAINGVQLPSEVVDEDGPVPVVLPVDEPARNFTPGLAATLSALHRRRFTGYLVDDDGSVVLLKNGRPTKYYRADDGVYGDGRDVEDLPDTVFGPTTAFHAPYSLVDAVEQVTPEAGGAADERPTDVEPKLDDETDGAEAEAPSDSLSRRRAEREFEESEAAQAMEDLGLTGGTEAFDVGDVAEAASDAGEEADDGSRPATEADVGAEARDDADDEAEDADETEAKKVDSDSGETVLDVGGDEIDLEEMYDLADEMFD